MFKTYLLVITILCQSYITAQLNWSNINGPTGGKFQFISVKNSNELIAASIGNSVFFSSDQGNSWIKKNNGLTSFQFTSLLSYSYGTFISTWDNGVFKYNISGNTWNLINSGLSTMNIQTLAVDSSNNIYAGGANGNIFKFNYGSSNWELIYSSDSISQISAFHIDKNNNFYLFSNDNMYPFYGGLFKSSNEGLSWTKIGPDWINDQGYAISTDAMGNIYFGYRNSIYRSSDSGATWENVGTFAGVYHDCLDLLSIGEENLFALISCPDFGPTSESERMIYSQDQGQNWEEIGLYDFTLFKLAYDSLNNILYSATSKGIFKSNNLGIDWIDINSSMDALIIYDLITDQNGTIYLSTSAGIYKSHEDNSAWISLFNGIPSYDGHMAIFDSSLYCYRYFGFYIFDQYLRKWIRKSEFQTKDLDQDEFGNLFICGQGDVMKSDDHGNTWHSIMSNLSDITPNCIEYLKDSILIVGGSGSGSYLTTNLGRVWESIPVAGADRLYYNNDSLVIATWGSFETRSTDLGVTWQEFNIHNYPPYEINDIVFIQEYEMYATAKIINGASAIFYSNDLGISWSIINQPATLKFLDYSIFDSTIYAGYSTSIYKSKITVTDVEESNISKVMEMNLSQNHPNPFNPNTVISYSVKETGLVKLRVYDILGSEVATLVNETKEAGNFIVEFKASNLPSGVYIYTIQVNGYANSKKMLLLK